MVRVEWLLSCLKENSSVPEDEFLLLDNSAGMSVTPRKKRCGGILLSTYLDSVSNCFQQSKINWFGYYKQVYLLLFLYDSDSEDQDNSKNNTIIKMNNTKNSTVYEEDHDNMKDVMSQYLPAENGKFSG